MHKHCASKTFSTRPSKAHLNLWPSFLEANPKTNQSKQRMGGGLVPLAWPKLKPSENFGSFSEFLFSGFVRTIWLIGGHEDVFRRVYPELPAVG